MLYKVMFFCYVVSRRYAASVATTLRPELFRGKYGLEISPAHAAMTAKEMQSICSLSAL